MDKFPITPNGQKKLLEEIKYLKTVKRPEITHAIAEAREHGDLSENAEYTAAREMQSTLEERISQLESMSANLDVIDITSLSNESVKFGATVTLLDDETEELATYTIVGEYEAKVSEKRISVKSPIAKSIIGKKVGDLIEVETPKGTKGYVIQKITYKEFDPWPTHENFY